MNLVLTSEFLAAISQASFLLTYPASFTIPPAECLEDLLADLSNLRDLIFFDTTAISVILIGFSV
jgi:hypothetical protein